MTPAFSEQARVSVPILMYHSISEVAAPRFRSFAVTPSQFSAHMAALHADRFTPLTVSRFVELTKAANPHWPVQPVVITFDDAFRDFLDAALPTLLEHGFPATLFVPTSYVGATSRWLEREGEADRQMLNWSGVEEAARAGIEIGSHTQTHPQLDLLPKAVAETEIRESKNVLEQRLQTEVATFAYPFGYWSPSVKSLVEQAGYASACAVRDLAATSNDDPYTLGRFTVPYGMQAEELLARVHAPTGRLASVRSNARAHASWLLRRAGVKKRGISGPFHDSSLP
jgi:peptidoglycan/xylan/chitin deacetylase (PgdA/CDA1 family)